jgi:hypothetical protein
LQRRCDRRRSIGASTTRAATRFGRPLRPEGFQLRGVDEVAVRACVRRKGETRALKKQNRRAIGPRTFLRPAAARSSLDGFMRECVAERSEREAGATHRSA